MQRRQYLIWLQVPLSHHTRRPHVEECSSFSFPPTPSRLDVLNITREGKTVTADTVPYLALSTSMSIVSLGLPIHLYNPLRIVQTCELCDAIIQTVMTHNEPSHCMPH